MESNYSFRRFFKKMVKISYITTDEEIKMSLLNAHSKSSGKYRDFVYSLKCFLVFIENI